ncbi:MFS transporter [Gordonia sp. ABSL11-1]|uniref:MFS transporter n=1 Tax=Gordonia sp. ABSL11-1 TaxID=3053924 RepID=UPI0025731C9D|nr:MFS transporter [Gordonia sp. ABSL11-1]MDL9948164.1 MFS transporter [Gordonia sp. ABSL11-1]
MLFATGIGNFMEWFDFAVYGFFAVSIGKTFFPTGNATTSLLSTLAVYGIAFLMRPAGGLFFGSIGDRLGRRKSLSLAVVMMGTATALIAVLPSYAAAGLVSPVLLVLLRAVQGFSAGGEWTGSAAFIIENAPANRRGVAASIVPATAALAVAAGAGTALIINTVMSADAVDSWGWRLPFLAAFPMTIVGLYMRLKLEETPVFREMQESGTVEVAPLKGVARRDLRSLGIAFALASITVLGFYYLATYVTTFLTVTVEMHRVDALAVVATGALLYGFLCPLAGVASDHVGRRPISLAGGAGLAMIAIPAFMLMATGRPMLAVIGIVLFGVFEAMHNVTTTVMLIELFPPDVRATGSATGYNLGAALIAGPGPVIAAALAAAYPGTAAPAAYVVLAAVVATAVLWRWLPETRWREIGLGDPSTSGKKDTEVTR